MGKQPVVASCLNDKQPATNSLKEEHMKQRESLFLKYPLRLDRFFQVVTILMALLTITSLTACAGQGVHTASPTSTQPGRTPSPIQVLQQAGPDAGLYIGGSIGI